ncbi:MAG TPA: hypothetical protein VGK25_11195 [Ignavibacteria bacterium]|jgi:hypothetical protein
MEPPVSYPESDNKYQGQKIYGRKSSGCAKFGCFGIVGGLILIVAIVVIGYFFVFPALTPNSLKGDFLDVTIVPDKNGKTKLWVLTDGSFNFIKTTKSPGKTSTGRECYFCKLWAYIYDPEKKEIIKKIKIERTDVITASNILYRDNEVWVVAREYGDNPPDIHIFDSETGEEKMDIKGLQSKYPELSGGISEVNVNEEKNPVSINFKTKDGRSDQVMDFSTGKIYDGWSKFNEGTSPKGEGTNSVYVLASQNNAPKKNLYIVTGPKDKVKDASSVESYVDNESSLKFFANATSRKLAPDKGFIEALILYQDADACVIVHQAVMDKDSDRMITCVNSSGDVRWVIDQKDLFKKARVDKDDPFSSTFFMKSKFGGMQQSGVFVFKLEGSGVMGFDYKTGKKLWELEF